MALLELPQRDRSPTTSTIPTARRSCCSAAAPTIATTSTSCASSSPRASVRSRWTGRRTASRPRGDGACNRDALRRRRRRAGRAARARRRARRRQLGRRLRRGAARDPAAGAGQRPRARRQRRLRRAAPPGPGLLRADVAARLPARDLPAFAERYMRPRSDADRRGRDTGVATTRQDPGLRAVAELWGSFSSPEHDLRAGAPLDHGAHPCRLGRRDPVIPLRLGRKAAAAIPGAELEVFDSRPLTAGERSRRGSPPSSCRLPTRHLKQGAAATEAVAERAAPLALGAARRAAPLRTAERRGSSASSAATGRPFSSATAGSPTRTSGARSSTSSAASSAASPSTCRWAPTARRWTPTPISRPGGVAGLIAAAVEGLDLRGRNAGRQRLRWRLLADRPGPAWRAPRRARLRPRPHLLRDALRRVAARRRSTACRRRRSDPQALGQLLAALEDPEVRALPAAYGLLLKHPLEPEALDSYALPAGRDEGVLHDVAKAMSSASTAPIRDAGEQLMQLATSDPAYLVERGRGLPPRPRRALRERAAERQPGPDPGLPTASPPRTSRPRSRRRSSRSPRLAGLCTRNRASARQPEPSPAARRPKRTRG